MLCGVSVVFNLLDDVLGLMSCKCSSENGQLLVGFQSTEAFGCLHHAGGGPAQRHRGIFCEGIVSKRLGSRYRFGRTSGWLKFKNPAAPAVRREAEEDWGR